MFFSFVLGRIIGCAFGGIPPVGPVPALDVVVGDDLGMGSSALLPFGTKLARNVTERLRRLRRRRKWKGKEQESKHAKIAGIHCGTHLLHFSPAVQCTNSVLLQDEL
jgi:hypothetical protein